MDSVIDNTIYNELNDRWYSAFDDPVALLRAESKLVFPWIHDTAMKNGLTGPLLIADLGCGGGFIANGLASYGHRVTGIDLSETSLATARKYDSTESVQYMVGDATDCTLSSRSYDLVVSCDVLEHVEEPKKLVSEAYRLLKPGGIFFFHTFDRNFISYLIVIKLVEWLVRNTPKNMHILSMFIKPQELRAWCKKAGFEDFHTIGMRPRLRSLLDRSIFKRTVPEKLEFTFTSNTWITYAGYAVKSKLNTSIDCP